MLININYVLIKSLRNFFKNINVKEASFEYINNDKESTFIIFQKGISPSLNANNDITLELYKPEGPEPVWKHCYSTDHVPSATSCVLDLASLYPDIPKSNSKIEYHDEIIKPDEHELELHRQFLKKEIKKNYFS